MLSHVSAAELENYVNGRLSVQDTALVQLHLEKCADCQLRLADVAIDLKWEGPEHRGEPRIPVDFKAHLKMLDPLTSVGPPHDVQVIEMSRSGLKVRTPRFLIPKTVVQVRLNNKMLLAEVRYCEKKESGYEAGLQRKNEI
ncbi:MAG TPA: PilZ domain-containing protein [Bryobacteraceae bacterium]|nr:PilZ domain-containing protein [Bryobacteraceae bacterium]